jgi:heme/copper-type cytochrome/quinol oxidase subunit 4
MKENKHTLNQQLRYIIGFTLCILLTAFSLWAAVFSGYSYKMVFAAIAFLAFVQAIMQLFQIQPTKLEQE